MDLVQGMPAPIAISFLQCLPLATVDRPAPRQCIKVAEGDLLVMVRAGVSLSIVALNLRRDPVAGLSAAVVSVAAVVSRQAAVEILRSVDGLPKGFLVAGTLDHCAADRLRGNATVLAALRAAAQMFAQPFSQSSATATVASLLNRRGVRVLASGTSKVGSRVEIR